mmetsp:Transcript_1976/g.5581  ORF Transcript_1976/g.5581 Transcript_1976/m.5581 type:complete len:87 (+) Transcript_1976:116-376(+)
MEPARRTLCTRAHLGMASGYSSHCASQAACDAAAHLEAVKTAASHGSLRDACISHGSISLTLAHTPPPPLRSVSPPIDQQCTRRSR